MRSSGGEPLARGRRIAGLLSRFWCSPPPSPGLSPNQLQELIPILERQGSGGLAWFRIRSTPLAQLPNAPRLQNAYRHHTLQVRIRERQLLEAIGHFRRWKVDPILAKGWTLGRLYPEAGLRPYGDLDFWVPPEKMSAAREALRSPDRPVVPIELHARFNELEDRRARDLLQRCRTETLQGTEIRVFAPEDHLRLVGLHALEHGLARPLWLCDVALLLAHLPGGFDWDLARSGEDWFSEGFRCSLILARDLLGGDLDTAGAPEGWTGAPGPSWLLPAALSAFGARDHYMAAPDPSELLFQPMALLRSARLRWANPIEATFRRKAPWNERSRLPHQTVDFLARTGSFIFSSPLQLHFHFRKNRVRP